MHGHTFAPQMCWSCGHQSQPCGCPQSSVWLPWLSRGHCPARAVIPPSRLTEGQNFVLCLPLGITNLLGWRTLSPTNARTSSPPRHAITCTRHVKLFPLRRNARSAESDPYEISSTMAPSTSERQLGSQWAPCPQLLFRSCKSVHESACGGNSKHARPWAGRPNRI